MMWERTESARELPRLLGRSCAALWAAAETVPHGIGCWAAECCLIHHAIPPPALVRVIRLGPIVRLPNLLAQLVKCILHSSQNNLLCPRSLLAVRPELINHLLLSRHASLAVFYQLADAGLLVV